MGETKQIYSFPPLSDEEFAELREDIAERGVMVPIEVDEGGNIIDGYHRLKACRELDITDIPSICREGWTEQEKRTQAIKLNIARRHLSQEQKREFIRELIKETPERSDRQIADALGVHHTTVGTVRRDLIDSGDVANLATSVDTLGREQPRLRKAPDTNPAVPDTIDEPVPSYREDAEDLTNDSAPAVQNYTENESNTEKNTYMPPRTMTPAEDFVMGMRDQADGLRRVLKVMLDDYAGNKELEDWLFSEEGIAASFEGIAALKEVIEEYERLIRARKK